MERANVIDRVNWKTLAVAVGIPLATGALSAIATMGSMDDFAALDQPPLSPPGWLFPVVWSALYILMGIASYIVFEAPVKGEEKAAAFKPYFLQLGFNFFWSIIFFNLGLYEVAFGWLLAMLALIVITTVRFGRIDRRAAYLMLPYIAWVLFAGYLNLGVAILN